MVSANQSLLASFSFTLSTDLDELVVVMRQFKLNIQDYFLSRIL